MRKRVHDDHLFLCHPEPCPEEYQDCLRVWFNLRRWENPPLFLCIRLLLCIHCSFSMNHTPPFFLCHCEERNEVKWRGSLAFAISFGSSSKGVFSPLRLERRDAETILKQSWNEFRTKGLPGLKVHQYDKERVSETSSGQVFSADSKRLIAKADIYSSLNPL